ncbi:MAG: carboxyl transferase domain-containing protein [Acidobacteriota bacterium]|nr:carboxyl transferase domain-containing protein [Acidobacteriota bacterium]MDQ7087267.1 carboxyl transferase domain-containing protein [Acidobacteriota bacterium]
MARVSLHPIGSPLAEAAALKAAEAMAPLEERLDQRREAIRAGWGEKYIERVHRKGKMTTWERIGALIDPGTRPLPVGTLVNDGETFGPSKRTSPGAGVVTAFCRIEGRWSMVIANDNTVASGSWWPRTPEKIERAQEMALRLRIPVVYLVDCSGLFLPEQARTFPGLTGAGAIFKMNSRLSAAGVPQVAGVFGDCIAGGGYMPIISDVVYMTEQAYMVIAGAALIKGAKSQKITSLDIGGPDVHVHLSACADYRVKDDPDCIARIRREISTLPSPAADYYRRGAVPAAPAFPSAELASVFPPDYRHAYDIRQVLARLLDDSLFREVLPETGRDMVCGVGRISGLWVGLIANNPQLSEHPELAGEKRPGSILYREGIAKISQFSRACNDDGLPLIWLQDVSGFDIGVEAEKRGLLGYGSSLIYTNSTNTVPMATVLLRKASGAGYYAMAGLPYEPVMQLATPIARLAVMEGRTLAIGAYRTRLDDNFEITADSEEERQEVARGMQEVEDRISADMDPHKAASQMDVDEVIKVGEMRNYLAAFAEMAYQSIGYRTVRNPRIWSLHDLVLLADEPR